MGFSGFTKYIRKGVGLLGKTAMHAADTYTGGLASKIAKSAHKFVDNNAGVIGKVARTIGTNFLSQDTRNKIHDYTQTALNYMPNGKLKRTLNKISMAAQGAKIKKGSKLLLPEEMKEAVKNPEAWKAKQARKAERKEARRAERKEARRAERKALKASKSSDAATPTTTEATSSAPTPKLTTKTKAPSISTTSSTVSKPKTKNLAGNRTAGGAFIV